MKAVVAAFNQEKALVGAFSVITNLRMELFEALVEVARLHGTVLGRYDIGNCLFEAAYDEVLDRCGCTPYYHWGVVDLPTILEQRPFCKVSAVIGTTCDFFKLSKIHTLAFKQNCEHLCLSF